MNHHSATSTAACCVSVVTVIECSIAPAKCRPPMQPLAAAAVASPPAVAGSGAVAVPPPVRPGPVPAAVQPPPVVVPPPAVVPPPVQPVPVRMAPFSLSALVFSPCSCWWCWPGHSQHQAACSSGSALCAARSKLARTRDASVLLCLGAGAAGRRHQAAAAGAEQLPGGAAAATLPHRLPGAPPAYGPSRKVY